MIFKLLAISVPGFLELMIHDISNVRQPHISQN